ncbi:unnamed protein product [Lampetra fluviatilis]
MEIVLPVVEEETQTSMWVARSLQVHKNMNGWIQVAVWSGEPVSGDTLTARATRSAPRPVEEDPELGKEMAAAAQGWPRRRVDTSGRILRGAATPPPHRPSISSFRASGMRSLSLIASISSLSSVYPVFQRSHLFIPKCTRSIIAFPPNCCLLSGA